MAQVMPRVSEKSVKSFKSELPYPFLMVEEGLELIQLNLDDNDELFALIELNRTYLRERLPWLDDIKTILDQQKFIITALDEYRQGKGISYSIKLNNKIIGNIGLNWIDYNNRSCGVGYWISENYMGNGIITKSCKRIINHCFIDLELHRFVLEAAVDNFSSISVANRLGMRLEGSNIDREWLYDHFVDSNIYAITSNELSF
ncbi:MAG: hypothetical protein CND89_03550 [Marine Group II euryarchaeote MED-G38]|nr:hypothetical protein [Euryarchaeota archaeon]OUV24491.1 MAG: hypothetical protein CBC57_07065 [Euryarchaeota archaeon TMED97]PDH22587.1 MAG: hypothetical protein CND89_03550 [Marine Group II euryarchaeote MED-G38]|tara:strand:- start:7851 stop:8456 length:606 start_codon:yes stop_codon:yes gene_type:complete